LDYLQSMNTGVALLGRAFAQTDVTLNQNSVTRDD
jgi:hypothetical protein